MSGVRDSIHPSLEPTPVHFNNSLRKTIGEDCIRYQNIRKKRVPFFPKRSCLDKEIEQDDDSKTSFIQIYRYLLSPRNALRSIEAAKRSRRIQIKMPLTTS
jgi:hypothetical protein